MQAEIITIGDEILIGQIVDTNSAYIGKALNSIGVSVYQITSIQDDKEHILKAMAEAEANADIVILTGGLGPTKDDITKHTICNYFNDVLVRNTAVTKNIERLWRDYIKKPIQQVNLDQALVPSKAKVLMNMVGSAPGMWIEKGEKVFISMPGVPFEMKALMEQEVLPRLKVKYKRPFIKHKTLLTYGIGESALAAIIEDWEDNLPNYVKLAYLPNLGKVRLRLSGKGFDEQALDIEIEKQVQAVLPLIKEVFTGFEEDGDLEVLIAKKLIEHKKTLSVAESCTGGKLAEIFTQHAGASSYFKGGLITYATQIKIDVLGVEEALINKYSVVSTQVAEAMAKQCRILYASDYAIATTGNAGPTKGDANAEIGTVYIAIASKKHVISQKLNLGNNRTRVINKAVNKALELLQKEIFKN
ncbi:CinA family nicotinamide mononucleotide deamidase-related protein [Lacinutrix sp.]|uniref:CinA family nicotinamide mononucleotide deamidase-related protein n=1 Tax=Lacinutrix sp. TaxID=1937692 RepID=UPI0026162DCE|nr:CinA family nicotinamide mononucleotide deamidase-related protein [Lacinutrix sp.]MDG1714585.1 CinA family nicotinamide mononucleotide deamidase-related protein [Lacinutrix sp.]